MGAMAILKLVLAYAAADVVAEHTDFTGTCHDASCADIDGVDEVTLLSMRRGVTGMATETKDSAPCLCVFDIDRTLTASQNESACNHTNKTEGIQDSSYDGGEMKLSEVGEAGVAHSECSKCYVGIVSQGNASGANSSKRKYIANDIIQTDVFREFTKAHSDALDWCDWEMRNSSHSVEGCSPFILRCLNAMKPEGVLAILKWYAARGVNISNEETYFFDDRTGNLEHFVGKGFNEHQISCSTRGISDRGDRIGKCGAQLSEIRLQKGHTLCSSDVPN